MSKLEKVGTAADTEQSNNYASPPSYGAAPGTSLSPEDLDQLNSAFSSLNLPQIAYEVTPDTCLAHLKLLFAFQSLKETIGYTDGLWEIYDSRLFPNRKNGAGASEKAEGLDDQTKKNLALLREKRWAIYVTRAVDRYESWWHSVPKNPLTEDDMSEESDKYTHFTRETPSAFSWNGDILPPLGK
jgi:hypothetical protein